ncbi:C2 domain-containing protein 3 isoform X2 [Ahaetulla prasina]|uniref:C2 domain-containing protein 3 isoform X2 n=1 Tax=Ahaetulla prasina TaxID=499056 RepID=UPI00264859A7|nr:C2 domain-containing protein 3 isoform X2 [Ahaetulla prasina]
MKPKKSKAGPGRAAAVRRRKALSDITPSTSLPPLVEGQLRCFLKLTVSKIVWMVAKPPASSLVRVRWWGETSNGTTFVPQDASQPEQKILNTTTCYPVRCGPKQFASYLTDMGALTLEVMTKSDHLPIGRVQIKGLAQLSPSHPISGFFTIVSPSSEKMGELQISLFLEPLSDVYESNHTVHNTNTNKDAAHLSHCLAPSQLHRPTGTHAHGRESLGSSRASTPRGKDHLYFQENSENIQRSIGGSHPHLDYILNAKDPKPQKTFLNSSDQEAQIKSGKETTRPVHLLPCNSPATKDLLTDLLDRGNRLRNAMAVSVMISNPDPVMERYEAQPSVKQDLSRQAGKTLKNPGLRCEVPRELWRECSEFDLDAEKKAVELLLGSSDLSPDHLVDGAGSPPESLSPSSHLYDSELNDPHYDQSLLENLFYTAQKSDSSFSDIFSEEEDEAGKRSRPQGPKLQRSPKASESSPHRQKKKTLETRASRSPAKPLPRETFPESTDESQAVNLSLDRLATLGRIRLARVVIESLRGIPHEDSSQSTPNQKSPGGKPPRPAMAKKRTFFVEYHFPVGTSKNGVGQTAVTTEIVRVASSKFSADGVKFQQRYVFPVHFSGSMITHWWKSHLDFNLFLKKGTQRKPVLIGTAAFPLRDVLQSEDLFVSRELPVKEDGVPGPLGPLQVSVELAANKDFSNIKASSASPRAPTGSIRGHGAIFQDAERGPPCSTRSPQSNRKAPARSEDPLPPAFQRSPKDVGQPPVPLPVSRNLLKQMSASSEEEGMLLHVLLMVSEGQIAPPPNGGLESSCNLYLISKLFSTEEATRSPVAWGTSRPTFHFSQITPVALTSKHLERLKNNVMVIEVWNKVLSPGGDRLLGLAKLPLHQFYVSFKDPKVSSLLLQAQYPVLAVDGHVPVVDVFSGQKNGTLKTILAMGSADQVLALQRVKKEEGLATPAVLRPPHALDPVPAPAPELSSREKEGLVEHTFEIHIEGVQGLTPLQSTVWGETDCYVQYHFPVQKSEPETLRDAEFSEKGLELKAFRTSTTLCVPDPTFRGEHHHSLLVPADLPVQRLLLSAFSARSLAGEGGGIHFEIWCRYYYPNVRDQMVARASLPLSRLCAMVTMQHRQEMGSQTFHLPVMPRIGSSGELHPRTSGLFQVSVKYRRSLKITENGLAAQTVPISIQIHAAAGLQAAARALAEKHPPFQYSAEIGLNTYVSILLPFLPGAEPRRTRTVARSFCPAFDHNVELPCHLLVQRSSGEACCLAELLQRSEVVFHLYHQPLNSAPREALKDCLLGTVRVPTRDLLIRRSGPRGWYPVILPEDLSASRRANVTQSVVGGLEISVAFVHPGDRERVLEAANRLGWNWEETYSEDPWEDSESESQTPSTPLRVTVSTPRLWLPLQSVLLAGEAHLNKSVYCYLRYKLYDQEATWSSLKRPKFTEGEKQGMVMFKKPNRTELRLSPALFWYFREEKLELQVWRAYGKDGDVERPLDTDRLIGSAYVDLAPLADSSRTEKTISGVFPLFRRNAANLGGAALRVHITVTPADPCGGSGNHEDDRDSSSNSVEEEKKAVVEQELEVRSEANPPVDEVPQGKPAASDLENTFAVSILVERAMHLSLKGSPLAERGGTSPCSYVTFVAADVDNPVTTATVENTDSPVWDFQHQTRLSKELLLDSQKTLVFKIWHKADVERVIGFASVDLSPLLSGFQYICGWYDITDLTGQCRGQVKVAVSPLENITHLKEERQARSCQARDSYPSFSSFSTRGTPKLSSSPWKSPEASSHARAGSRYEEHVQNVRRFHTSLQQAEEKTAEQAEGLDSLSLSSHTSLFRALRKNLNELDEIQRYFSEKLTRPLTDLSAPCSTMGGLENQRPSSRRVDPEEDHLQKKPIPLVSKVSSQHVGLWPKMTSHPEEPSQGHEDDGPRFSSADQALLGQENDASGAEILQAPSSNEFWNARAGGEEPLFALGKSPPAEDTLYGFFDPTNFPRAPPSGFLPGIHGEEDSARSHSEEECEETIVEPRTLNEITTVTDRTSPWSSFLSETEQEPIQEAPMTNWDDLPKESAIGSSSAIQDDPLSVSSITGSRNSPSREEDGDNADQEPELEAGEEEPAAAGRVEPADIPQVGQGRSTGAQEGGPEEASSTHQGGGDFTRPQWVPPGAVEGRENLHRDPQQEDGMNVKGEEGLQLCPPSRETVQRNEAYSGEDDEDLPEEFNGPMITLSEPIVVPNFFLPPQHLEVSMRLLSASSSPLAAAHKAGKDRSEAPGIPHRRPKPSPMPLQLPEEEMKRIARIFSTQFSEKA